MLPPFLIVVGMILRLTHTQETIISHVVSRTRINCVQSWFLALALTPSNSAALQIWRTGDRTPGETYPSDVHQESSWPRGFDQLTPMGMQQAVRIGQLLQNIYIHQQRFLDPVYQQKEVILVWALEHNHDSHSDLRSIVRSRLFHSNSAGRTRRHVHRTTVVYALGSELSGSRDRLCVG